MDRYYMPLGLKLVEKLKRSPLSFQTNQIIVFILTFIAYASYHVARKTMSVIKSSLDPQLSSSSSTGWAPFNGSDGSSLLGELDVAFLSTYALGMYFSGHLFDKMRNQRHIIFVVGMTGSGVAALLFGAGYWVNIHNFYYFLAVQILAGLFQSTAWPFLIPVIGNWFAKTNRSGLIMGMWNATSPVGDVSGALIASAILGAYGWEWSVVFSGLLILFLGVSVFLFLYVSPESAGFDMQNDGSGSYYRTKEEKEESLLLRSDRADEDHGQVTEELVALGFIEACKIPGVVPFALSLFFSKLVGYTFLYWLPFYISHTAIDGEYLSSEKAGYLSTLYDIGCMAGRILAGHISDHLRARAFTSASCTYFAIPCLFLYRSYGHVSLSVNMILMFMTGMFVSGPFTIAAAVSADLGTRGNSSRTAASTVTAIINATGIVGASLGPLLTGYISAKSWNGVFIMLMVSALISGLLLTRLVVAEVSAMVEEARMRGTSSRTSTPTI